MEQVYELDPDLWPAFRVFTRCATQWRMVIGFGSAYYQGLDYTGARQVMDLYGIRKRDRSAVFEQLQIMETEALKCLNKAA